jgi:hypothetical protein
MLEECTGTPWPYDHKHRLLSMCLMLFADEVQNLLLPRTSGRLDKPAQDSARLLLKRLLCYSSNYCMWAVTGSSMAVFWAQLDAMPVNGYAPLLHNVRVHLPATHEPAAISSVLDSILDRDGVGRPAGVCYGASLTAFFALGLRTTSRQYATLVSFVWRSAHKFRHWCTCTRMWAASEAQ